jgi:CBS-domain-containing membrane protein
VRGGRGPNGRDAAGDGTDIMDVEGSIAMQVFEVMTRQVRTVRADESTELAKWALKFWNHRHLPVVDATGHVVGMLTPTDLLEAMGERDTPAPIMVRDVMQHPVLTIGENERVENAVPRMREASVHAMPVVDHSERLVGIVTDVDVLAAIASEPPRGID